MCRNRFPDNLKSDNAGTLANSRQASKDKAKSTQTETSLFLEEESASTITEVKRPYTPVFFPPLLQNYEVMELWKKNFDGIKGQGRESRWNCDRPSQ